MLFRLTTYITTLALVYNIGAASAKHLLAKDHEHSRHICPFETCVQTKADDCHAQDKFSHKAFSLSSFTEGLVSFFSVEKLISSRYTTYFGKRDTRHLRGPPHMT